MLKDGVFDGMALTRNPERGADTNFAIIDLQRPIKKEQPIVAPFLRRGRQYSLSSGKATLAFSKRLPSPL
jgi:hypothetical protein